MDPLETDDQLTIVNRSMEHLISKNIIRKIPYFEMMLSHDVLESQENKVELDFDEEAFKSFLHWIEFDNVIIDMKYVITLCNISDYFGMNYLINECTEYFRQRFSIDHLPTVIPQVAETSMLINSDTLNTLICRHFLKIANSTVWSSYPLETIEYICKLDLMIYSEYQVFDAIMKWVNFNADSRKCHLGRLLRLLRCCHLEDKHLSKMKENELFKSSGFQPKSCSPYKHSYCFFDRAKQNCFIIIEKLKGTDLRITIVDKNVLFLFSRDIKLDESIPLNLIHDGHFTDIFYHSGRKAIRIDWNRNKYRFINGTEFRPYLFATCKLIVNPWTKYYWKPFGLSPIYRYTIRDTTDARLIYTHGHDEEFDYWLTKLLQTGDKTMKDSKLHNSMMRLRVTVLSNYIFILTNNLEFGKFNVRHKHFKKIELPKLEEGYQLKYESLFLTSSVDHDDRVFLIDESTEKVFCFNVNTQKWSLIGGLFIDPYPSSNSGRSCGYSPRESNKLITLTHAFLPLDIISTCSSHNLN